MSSTASSPTEETPPEALDHFPLGDDPAASQDSVDLGNRNPE